MNDKDANAMLVFFRICGLAGTNKNNEKYLRESHEYEI